MGKSDVTTLKMIHDQGRDTQQAFQKFKDEIQREGCTPGRADRQQLKDLRETVKNMPADIAAKVAASVNGNNGNPENTTGNAEMFCIKIGKFRMSAKGKQISKLAVGLFYKAAIAAAVIYGILLLYDKAPRTLTPPIIQKIAAMPAPEEHR